MKTLLLRHFLNCFLLRYLRFTVLFALVCFLNSCGNGEANHHKITVSYINGDTFLRHVPDTLKYLLPIFDSIKVRDQKYRDLKNLQYFSEHEQEQHLLDSINQSILLALIKRYGWLNKNQIGFMNYVMMGQTLVHADLKTKLELYPTMAKALENANLSVETFSAFEDKLNLQTHHYQYYGTQIVDLDGQQIPYPIFDVDNLNARRKRLLLNSESEYLEKYFGIKWDIEQYKSKKNDSTGFFKVIKDGAFHDPLEFVDRLNEGNTHQKSLY